MSAAVQGNPRHAHLRMGDNRGPAHPQFMRPPPHLKHQNIKKAEKAAEHLHQQQQQQQQQQQCAAAAAAAADAADDAEESSNNKAKTEPVNKKN